MDKRQNPVPPEVTEDTAPKKKVAFTKPFNVRITVDALNIREAPTTNSKSVGVLRGRGLYTVNATANGEGSVKGWGRLLSGEGWISLNYAEKVD